MEQSDKDRILQKILSLIESLPPIPENIQRMRAVCANPNSSFRDLVPIIEKDPCLCADILHMANSAYFGLTHKVESVREAVRYIGFNSVVDFITVSFSNKAVRAQFSSIRNLEEYFAHSNNVAKATRCLAKAAGKRSEVQEFYTIAGLLHDIGRLVILMVSDAKERLFLDDMSDDSPELTAEEHDLFGVDHCLVGKRICEKWNFSAELQTAILRHHSPIKDPFCDTAAFILLAHFVSMEDFPLAQVTAFYPAGINARLGLSPEMIVEARNLFLEESGW
ncbi:MAG: HDOD domain-containing protein [Pontiellaceae bacterium]|nr:HDOD domain-containing protein [Pontiellaceae bacterium]MBN2786650.1 HDOD domain-containing protein [Pontiellaceae bacterium]